MSKDITEENLVLVTEYKWLLNSESHRTYKELTTVLSVAIDLLENKSKTPEEKFIMHGLNGSRCILRMSGFVITSADINIKILRHSNQIISHTTKILHNHPTKLAQLQEATNHLNEALQLAETALELPNHETAHQLVNELEDLIVFLRKSKDVLSSPSKSALNKIASFNDFNLIPPLPSDLDLTFTIQSPKVICSINQLLNSQKGKSISTGKIFMETTVPRLNDFMLIINRAFNLCQMLKDKFAYFLKLTSEPLNLKRIENHNKPDDDNIFENPDRGQQ